jgi:hypothetical protein
MAASKGIKVKTHLESFAGLRHGAAFPSSRHGRDMGECFVRGFFLLVAVTNRNLFC